METFVRPLRQQMDHANSLLLLRQVNLPFRKGPEDRYDFASFQDRNNRAFIKCTPPIIPLHVEGPLVAPLRDDVPLIDPCSGFMSAGGDADLQPGGRRISPMVEKGLKPNETIPNAPGRAQTPPVRPSAPEDDLGEGKQWNSSAVLEAALRARLGGWTSSVRVSPAPPKELCSLSAHRFTFNVNPTAKHSADAASENWRDEAARRYMYSSSAKRSYGNVPWDVKLPPRIKPPSSTKEKMADPVSQRFTLKRYQPEAEIWQAFGNAWDSFQTRTPSTVTKPITFGCVGAENLEDIDNPDKEIICFTIPRTFQPQYTSTAHRPNIPGYTGKVHWTAVHPAHSKLPTPIFSTTTETPVYIPNSGSQLSFKKQGPFSRMVTTVSPFNPFNKVEEETIDF
ncbi:spermatogenesis-associated protein 48 isoform X2 [Protopterus annectens]|uniref:spermatogenesis-associated protein 48 isoform X2 n=1 Tax=Protopterus annectens TaxID=7888 RepID=UPI001CFAB17C|nr:spermatogenesis-associated protein 48 isoform X2 [Protopterus annectens]